MNNKKKILVVAMVLSMVAILAIGSTIAYFTSNDFVPNTFVMGDVHIDLDESFAVYDEETNLWTPAGGIGVQDEFRTDNNQYYAIYPGAVLPKDPTVHNNGANDAYIRVTVTANPYALGFLWGDDAADSRQNFERLVDLDTTGWTFEEGSEVLNINPFEPDDQYNATYSITYRYNWIVRPENSTTPLFTKVTIPTALETMYDVNEFNFDIYAEAIQSDTFANADEAWDAFEAQENPQL